jgi:xanthine dehydrogenase accessory factor
VKDIYDIVAEIDANAGAPLALATLVKTEGSSYRRAGARLAIFPGGHTVGSLSGGCIEEEIAARAAEVIQSGEPVVAEFDTRRRFGCHGKIYILIERIGRKFLQPLRAEIEGRRNCFIVTTAEGSSVHRSAFFKTPNEASDNFPAAPFVQEIHPPIRLIMFGDGPDSLPLQRLCSVLGWQSVAISSATDLLVEPDEWTAAIVKSHNFGRDFVALAKLLPLNLRYVGLIGPKKRRDELLNGLLEIGISMTPGFFAPAGLDLNAETPEEIALGVVSEIQRVFAEGSGQSLRDRKQPIHDRKQTGVRNPVI